MLELLAFKFMRTALLVAIFIGAATACIGQVVVLKRQANIGDALSHSALAGVALGVVLGFNPTIWALIGTLLAAFVIELVRRLFPRYAEIASAVVIAFSVGLAAILSGMAGNGKSFHSYLFGSIVAISPSERNVTIGICSIVILTSIILYKELFFISFDFESAKIAGINTTVVDVVFILMTAFTVGVASRSVGTLVVSSLLVLPYASAMQLHLNYKQTFISSIIIGIFNTTVGVILSYQLSLAPGGTIVILSVIILILLSIINKMILSIRAKKLRIRKN